MTSGDLAGALEDLGDCVEELRRAQALFRRQNDAAASAREKLEAQNRRYRDFFDLAPVASMVTSSYGIIQAANQACGRLLNTPPEFLPGRSLSLYIEKPEKSAFLSLMSELREKGEVTERRLRIRPRVCSPIPVSLTVSARYFEKSRATPRRVELHWVLRNLVEQQKAEEILRESEERYRSLFENSQEGISRTTPEGRFTAANPALARMLGYDSPEELLRVRLPDICVDPEDRRRLLQELESAPQKALRNREVLLKRKDGRPVAVCASVRAMGDPQGRTAAYESFIQDISDRRRLDEELRRRERLAAVGSTVAVLTHELSNPLTGMYATIELLERRLKGKETDNPDLVSALCALRTETYRMGDLVNDFRSLAQTHYAFEPVSLPEVISELLKIQESNYAELGIRVETRFPPVSPPVMGDRNKLKQALLNLLKNGVEAMPGGGVLTINADVLGSQMALEIRDTGCGIPDGVDIFEPFVTTKEYGTGLGLPLVRQIVNEHGGVITHGSRPGQGTFFRLLLPVRSLEKKTAQAARIDGDGEPGKPIGESGEIKVYERNR